MKRSLVWLLGGFILLAAAFLVLAYFLASDLEDLFANVEGELAGAPPAANGEGETSTEDGEDTASPEPPAQPTLPEEYQVSIEAPKRMTLDTERDLRVKVFIEGEGFAPDDLSSVTEGAMEAVSRELSAEVSGGSAFEIRPPAEVRQRLVGNEIDWVFGIKAVETGEHRLIVSIAQWREAVPTVLTEKTWAIEVRVDPVNALLTYLARHLPETIGAGIVLLVGTLFAVWAARMRKKAGLQPNSDDTDG